MAASPAEEAVARIFFNIKDFPETTIMDLRLKSKFWTLLFRKKCYMKSLIALTVISPVKSMSTLQHFLMKTIVSKDGVMLQTILSALIMILKC